MPLPTLTCSDTPHPWQIALGLGRRARKLGNVLAFHLIVDGHAGSLHFTWGIPWLFTLVLVTPLPINRFTRWITGQGGERAEYGFWHDYHETKLQWRRIINLPVGEGGWEKRYLHRPTQQVSYRHEHYVSSMVGKNGNAWAQKYGVDRWALILATWRVRSSHCWIPDLYDHRFTLRIQTKAGQVEEASTKAVITPHLCPKLIFAELARTLRPET